MQRWVPLLVIALLGSSVAAAAPESRRPNLLLLVAEDMGPRVGAFGDPVAQTPALDALAKQGVRFPNTFTTAGVCAPSRAALITGMHQISIGAQHMRTSSRPAGGYSAVPPQDVKAFPEVLRAAGYYTLVEQKLDYQFSGPLLGSGPFTIWDAEGEDASWNDRDPGQPFFAMLNFMETHESGIFKPLGHWPHSGLHFAMQLYRAWLGGLRSADGPVSPAQVHIPPYYPDAPVVRADLARHYNNIHQMDAAVSDVLAQLDADGLAETTIVIWTTDHGDGLPRAKRELFDSGLRVPMIVRWPEALRPPHYATGAVDDRLVSFVDLAPTLLDWAGVSRPEYFQGRNFVEEMPRAMIHASRDRIDEVEDRQRATRDARFKYIRSYRPDQPGGHPLAFRDNQEIMRELWRMREAGELNDIQGQWFEAPGPERLFDVQADPHEVSDLAGEAEYAADLARLRSATDAWLARAADTSEVPEADMVERFWPGGKQPQTPAPELLVQGTRVSLAERSDGASLGVKVDNGRWRLYTQPIEVERGATVRAKAVRYGFHESEERSARVR